MTTLSEADKVETSTGGTTISLVLGDNRTRFNIFYDINGDATLTVEAREQGGTWREFDIASLDFSADEKDTFVYTDVTYYEIRATINQNLDTLELVVKGT